MAIFTRAFLSLAAVGVIGATIGACRHSKEPEYSLGFYNNTPAQITDARADWTINGNHRSDGGGIMNAGVEALLHEESRPIPVSATVSWTTADGGKHRQPVQVASLISDPPTFSGTIFFKIESDGSVKVVPLTYVEVRRLVMQQKPYP